MQKEEEPERAEQHQTSEHAQDPYREITSLPWLLFLEQLPIVAWCTDTEGVMKVCNQACCTYLGCSPDLKGRQFLELVHPEDRVHCVGQWTIAFAQQNAQLAEYRLLDADKQQYRWHLIHIFPCRDSSGMLRAWLHLAFDIESYKQRERTLLQQTEELQHLHDSICEQLRQMQEHTRAQQRFLSIMGHEFRTSLTGIEGFSELLHAERFPPSEVQELAGDIYTDATRLHRMIDTLLDFERMRSGNMTLQVTELDFYALIHQVTERMQMQIHQSHDFVLQLDPHLPHIEGDEDKLYQVLANLLSNAFKYAPGGGRIEIIAQKEAEHIHLSISDQGIGIAPEALETIFDPYRRIQSTETTNISGTGLGLPIVREIVHLHHGRVWAESTLGQGTTFHVMLPCSQQETLSPRAST